MQQNQDAVEALTRWISYSHANGLGHYTKHFWTLRDVLEGILKMPPEAVEAAATFVEKTCKDSAEKTLILEAINAEAPTWPGIPAAKEHTQCLLFKSDCSPLGRALS